MLGGLDFAMFKIAGEAVKAGYPIFSWFVLTLGVAGAMGATFQVYLLNLAFRNYQQIDAIPTSESLGLLFQILSGLVLFHESSYYTWL